MANETEKTALNIGEKIAEEQNVYIVDVEYKKTGGEYSLCYYIDKKDGVGIDDCETFSRAVEVVLDREDPIPNEYILEVSSPGAQRQLRTEREFLYYIGRKVDIKLYKPLDGIKEFDGILEDYKDKTAYIEVNESIKAIPVKDAAYIRLSL